VLGREHVGQRASMPPLLPSCSSYGRANCFDNKLRLVKLDKVGSLGIPAHAPR